MPNLACRSAVLFTLSLVTAGPSAHAAPVHSPDRTAAYAGLGAYGAAVVVHDDRIYIGAPGELELFPMPASQPGAVIVLERGSDGTWREAARVTAEGGAVGDRFGAALGVDGATLVVGAPRAAAGRGAVYVFARTATGWARSAVLQNDEGAEGDEFGAAVAIAAGRILVGAPGRADGRGAVIAYDERDGAWARAGVIAGPDENGRFGTAVALSGARAAVGAPGPRFSLIPIGKAPELRPGAVHLLEAAADGWTLGPALRGIAEGPGLLGTAVVLRADDLFASAPFAGNGLILHYVRGSDGAWSVADSLTTDAQQPSGLGLSMALAGEDLWAGAPLGAQTGAGAFAWVFSPAAGRGYTAAKVEGPAFEMAFFGSAIGAADDIAVLGAPGDDILEGSGHVYVRRDGAWTRAEVVIDRGAGMDALTGEPVLCQDSVAHGFGCADVDLIAFLPIADLGARRGVIVNDLWGWTDPETGREYAIVGRTDATVFVDVTDAGNPRVLGELPLTQGARPNLWRDMKVYADHAFIVADGAGEHGMQVFDLRRLRAADGGEVFEPDALYDGIASAHNIVMNETSGLAVIVGSSGGGSTCGGGLHMVDVRKPLEPVFAGCFADASTGFGSGYTHDAQCVRYHGPDTRYRDHDICLGSNGNALSIADVTDREKPVALAAATYPNSGFLHQGWFSDDHQYFYMNDETDEVAGMVERTRTLVWDLAELDDPVLVNEHLGTNAASDHNLYVRGNFMYQSNYVSGLRILDISDPARPTEVGFFDTVTAGEDVPGFAGSWSNYPFFRSGNILVSSMREGLCIVKKRTTLF